MLRFPRLVFAVKGVAVQFGEETSGLLRQVRERYPGRLISKDVRVWDWGPDLQARLEQKQDVTLRVCAGLLVPYRWRFDYRRLQVRFSTSSMATTPCFCSPSFPTPFL